MVSDSMVVMDNTVMENKMMQELLQLICVLHLLLSFHLDDGSRSVIRNVDGKKSLHNQFQKKIQIYYAMDCGNLISLNNVRPKKDGMASAYSL